jgi:hypothetical protein
VSNALAIAGVTAVLKDLLDDGLIDHRVTDAMGQGVTVSALAPDAIQLSVDAQPRLNLFMHQATPNAAWRNAALPSRDGSGRRVANPPLALDLHYLVTAYGSADLQAEVLLGYAMQLLHETPVLPREAIRTALNPPDPVNGSLLPSVYRALHASALADQVEQIKVTPEAMNTEELSKLWTALQAHYRPTATYLVTVVLIEPTRPVRTPLPVLSRGPVDPVTQTERGIVVQPSLVPPFPEILSITLPASRIAALLGDTIEFDGHDLDGANHALLLSNSRLAVNRTITPPANVTPAAVSFTLPNDPANYPAGIYSAILRLRHPGDPATRLTNELAVAIAPRLVTLASPVQLDGDGNLTLTPTCTPDLRPNQRVSLILGGTEVLAQPFNAPTSTPTFVFSGLPTGTYWARLRVDGVDSLLIDRSSTPPKFAGPSIQVLP